MRIIFQMNINLKKIMRIFLSIPKTLLFNFYYLPFSKAVRLPILVGYDTRIKDMGAQNSVKLTKFSTGCVRIGISPGSFTISEKKVGLWDVSASGCVIFRGTCDINRGSVVNVAAGAILDFGEGFSNNSGCVFSCSKKIKFGYKCLLGWNCLLIDGDGHNITDMNGQLINQPKEIFIGNHVWLSADVTILKGTTINDNSIVGTQSCVSGKFNEDNIIIGGGSARIIKRNVNWS